ncbi:MAG: hypothetical protein ACLRPX_05730 [Ruthenibacterium sp.]
MQRHETQRNQPCFAALLAGALAAWAGRGTSAGGSAPKPKCGPKYAQSQSTPQSQSAGPAPAAGRALSREELAALWQALGLGQSAWWCADDETVTWGGLACTFLCAAAGRRAQRKIRQRLGLTGVTELCC